jgi:uncharacterized membrane protein YidH (DUF202 family)
MNQQEETLQPRRQLETLSRPPARSRKGTDHLANERTFLAWIRTGLATIPFGFVVERFALVVCELDPKTRSLFVLSFHASTLIGVALTALGVLILLFALIIRLVGRNERVRERRTDHITDVPVTQVSLERVFTISYCQAYGRSSV